MSTQPDTDILANVASRVLPSPVLIDQRHLIRERIFVVAHPSLDTAAGIIRQLLAEHITGKVILNLSQGGIQNIKVEERSAIFLDNSPSR